MLSHIRLGVGISRTGEQVIVMGLTNADTFAVWNQQGSLLIYDANCGDILEPLHAATVWEAIRLFTAWCVCDPVLQ